MAIRVLIVDDSATVRQLLTEILSSQADCEVVGWAGNGIDGLDKIRALRPDVVIMDVEMPLMDGVEALAVLMDIMPVPVVMFSAHTAKGAETTLRALDLGAVEVLEKPMRSQDWHATQQKILAAVRGAAGANLIRRQRAGSTLPGLQSHDYDFIIIGCSTGGPAALSKLLPSLPSPYPLPIIVVQHMPEMFLGALAARLDKYCSMPVALAVHGMPVEKGHIWIAPGDAQTTVIRRQGALVFKVGPDASYQGLYQPSLDLMLASAAAAGGQRVLAFVLTGMGRDGLEGAAILHEAGGTIITQDKESSVIYGMPGAVYNAGLASWQLSLGDIGRLLRRLGR